MALDGYDLKKMEQMAERLAEEFLEQDEYEEINDFINASAPEEYKRYYAECLRERARLKAEGKC